MPIIRQSARPLPNEFRDEVRPRFGVMRSREFLMKDATASISTPPAPRFAATRLMSNLLPVRA
jgi:hypothetical protein